MSWVKEYGKWRYYIGNNMLTGWQKLNWSKGTDWFYFDKESGNMLTGLQKVNDHKLEGTFYFDPETGALVK